MVDIEDPVGRWPGKYAYTDAICRNVLTPLASRFQTNGIQRTRGTRSLGGAPSEHDSHSGSASIGLR